jgi:hypothetical protein
MAKKGADLTNGSVFSWQADSYNDPSFDGVLTNADVSTFADPAANRALLSGRAQKFRRSIKVDDFAQNVDNVAGVGKKRKWPVAFPARSSSLPATSRAPSAPTTTAKSRAVPHRSKLAASVVGRAARRTDLPIPAA